MTNFEFLISHFSHFSQFQNLIFHKIHTFRSYTEVTTELPKESQKGQNDGMKLFSKSKTNFKSKPKTEPKTTSKSKPDLLTHRKRTLSEEDFASVAVSPDWVLNQEGVHYKGPDESRSKVVTEI